MDAQQVPQTPDRPAALRVYTSGDRTTHVVRVTGELDAASRPLVESALSAALREQRVILDLRGLTFMDSSGVHVLVEARRHFGERLMVRSPGRAAMRVLSLVDAGRDALGEA